MNREQRRAAAKQAKKNNNPELEEKITLFSKLPDHCMVCDKEFDKQDKKMVQEWSVIVHDKEEKVRLYCPPCWDQAVKLVEEVMHHLEDSEE